MIPAFLWGTTYAVTQEALTDWPALLLGALRALPAGLLLLALKPSLPTKAQWRPIVIIGCINIGVFFSLIFLMALRLPSAIASVGMVSVPVFAMIIYWVTYRQKPSVFKLICGFALVAFAWTLFNPSSMTLDPIGMLAMFGAISCIIIGSLLTQALGKSMHWYGVVTWQLIVGGIGLSLAALVQYFIQPHAFASITQVSLTNVIGLTWIIVLNTALAYALYVWLLQRMSVVDFTFAGVANPIAGVLFGWLLLGETFQLSQYALMAAMVIFSMLPQVMVKIQQIRTAQ